jgi:hypothetical protein
MECLGAGSILIGSKNDRVKRGLVDVFAAIAFRTRTVCPRCGGKGLLIRDGHGNYRPIEDDRS